VISPSYFCVFRYSI